MASKRLIPIEEGQIYRYIDKLKVVGIKKHKVVLLPVGLADDEEGEEFEVSKKQFRANYEI